MCEKNQCPVFFCWCVIKNVDDVAATFTQRRERPRRPPSSLPISTPRRKQSFYYSKKVCHHHEKIYITKEMHIFPCACDCAYNYNARNLVDGGALIHSQLRRSNVNTHALSIVAYRRTGHVEGRHRPYSLSTRFLV